MYGGIGNGRNLLEKRGKPLKCKYWDEIKSASQLEPLEDASTKEREELWQIPRSFPGSLENSNPGVLILVRIRPTSTHPSLSLGMFVSCLN